MRYVLIGWNNDGGRKGTLHASFDEVKQAARDYLTDPENMPAITDEDRATMERELSELTGECVEEVSGSSAWKETLYIAPMKEG